MVLMSIFKSTSRFKLTELVEFDGKIVPGLMKKYQFLQRDKLSDNDIVRVEIKNNRAGRPDLISNDLYGTTQFKWILILFNNVINPFDGWPKTSTTIEAPKNSVVWREL